MGSKVSTRKKTTRTITAKPKATVSSIKPKKTAKAKPTAKAVTPPDPHERLRLISEAAYFRAEARGFAPGYDEIDWLEAEREVEQAMEIG